MSKVDTLFSIAARPTAVVAGTFQVLTNPFREERKSFLRRYHGVMADMHDADLFWEVRACSECDNGVSERMARKGTQVSYYYSYGQEPRFFERDTHCAKHWDRVKTHQNHLRASRKAD